MTNYLPEILAPVGNREMLDAALAAGADAVYLASKDFGARAYADNFDDEELAEVIDRAHWNNCKVFVTFNTLVKAEEMEEALDKIGLLADMGCDAIIIQDPGLIRRAHKRYPDLALHGSTQMSVTSLQGASLLKEMGLTRIVLGREVSLDELRRIKEALDLELEIFIHGSLCVSVSGQCLMSSFAGGRSGNRGRCAQPCRKSYRLERPDGKLIGDENTYISPRDLETIDALGLISEVGLDSLKIEGRMKKPEYVYAAVRSYRSVLRGGGYDRLGLDLVTNRPFTRGFLLGDFGTDYLFDRSIKAGKPVGRMQREGGRFFLVPDTDLLRGDIIEIRSRRHYFPLTLTDSVPAGRKWFLPQKDLLVGEEAFLIYRGQVKEEMQEAFQSDLLLQRPISLSACFRPGDKAVLEASSSGYEIRIEGDLVQRASKQALSAADLKRSLEKLGGTGFFADRISINLEEECFMPVSQINRLRREAVGRLREKILAGFHPIRGRKDRPNRIRMGGSDEWNAESETDSLYKVPSSLAEIRISLDTVRGPKDFEGLIHRIGRVIVSEQELLETWTGKGPEIVFALPRLMEEEGYLHYRDLILSIQDKISAFSARTINDLGFFSQLPLKQAKNIYYDYPMNIFNRDSLAPIASIRPDSYIPSPELSFEEIEGLVRGGNNRGLDWELIVYGRLTGMLMKHCPASAVRGCRSDKDCPTCSFRKDLFLVDSFGRRELIRRAGSTEVLLPDLIDLRLDPSSIEGLKPNGLRLIDRGEEEIVEVIREWGNWLSSGGKENFIPGRAYRNMGRSLGNYRKGVQ